MSSADVARGKEQLKATVLDSLDSTVGLFKNVQTQAILTGNVLNAVDLIAAINAVTDAEVSAVSISFFWLFRISNRTLMDYYLLFIFHPMKAAKKVAAGKWALGAVGNLETVPFVDEL